MWSYPTLEHLCWLQNDFNAVVEHGFQASATWHQGKELRHDCLLTCLSTPFYPCTGNQDLCCALSGFLSGLDMSANASKVLASSCEWLRSRRLAKDNIW